MNAPNPQEGEVWYVNLGSVFDPNNPGAHFCNHTLEIGLRRPCFVLKRAVNDLFVVIPITKGDRQYLPHVVIIEPVDGCVALESSLLCGNIRAVSRERFVNSRGPLAANKIAAIKVVVQSLLN